MKSAFADCVSVCRHDGHLVTFEMSLNRTSLTSINSTCIVKADLKHQAMA